MERSVAAVAYRVVKWVKGIAYEYEQRSFRVGNQVRTESVYIGPAAGGNLHSLQSPTSHPTTPDNTLSSPSPSKARRLSLQKPATSSSSAPLVLKVDVSRYRMSVLGLQAEHRRLAARLERLGVSALSEIRIEHGAFGHHKKLLRNIYSVTVPRFGSVNREKLRSEYRKATARATLDGLAQSCPDAFAELAYAFDASHRATQRALTSYLLATEDPEKWIKAFALKVFGYMNPVAGGRLASDALGVVEYGDRKDWQTEFCSLYAAVQKKGYARFQQDILHQLQNARRAEAAAIRKKTVWRFARRRAVRRARARIDANVEILHKLLLMKSMVDP